ncbi:connexin 27.5 [Plakobranchus ocellatus]|uniref:Connexin 27.5 n=1 Tax=Plakobranchus ocellatus TaxID=259542 RepID=A0AAV3ZC50_9GAST|nr:connexin 27.5 [Plakobranchus ocellatus]
MSEPKRAKFLTEFKEDYTKEWPFIKRSRLGEHHSRCEICCSDMKIASGGHSDIQRHTLTPKHMSLAKCQASTTSLVSMFQPRNETANEAIMAEVLFTILLVAHNLPLSMADHMGKLFRAMFPDSEIAEQYACARTKTRHIIDVLADDVEKKATKGAKQSVFSLSTDGSNDRGAEQLYPLVLCYRNGEQVVTNTLTITTPVGASTGANIFEASNKELCIRGLDWCQCLSFGCDNASVMVGRLNGVATHIKEANPTIHIQGCPCHLLHLAAKKVRDRLQDVATDLLLRFVKLKAISEASNLYNLEFHRRSRQKDRADLMIGEAARFYLSE